MSKDSLLTRRRAIATIGAAGTLLLPSRLNLAAGTPHPDIAFGTVFEDRNGDGRGAKARGIAGVMVSNGLDVTMTDSDGRWSLPVQSGDSIFVIKPSHWTTVGHGPSSFSYLHQPEGTPVSANLRSPAIEPTGALPKSIDFPLLRQPQSQCFEALLFADTQAADAKELGYVRQVLLSATRATGAAFAIHHGDAMADDLTLLPQYLNILNETGLVWHHCPGNHDMNLDTVESCYAFETWKRFVGPTTYAFQHAGATFILLNNVDYFGCGGRAKRGRPYRGLFGEKQLRFVSNVLRHVPPDQLVVVSMHIPLQSFDNPDSEADTAADRNALLKLLSTRPHTVSFSGHSHTTEHHYFGRTEGFDRNLPHHHQVLTAACGSWWSGPLDSSGVPVANSRDGTPKGFHVLSVDGNHYATRYVPFGPVADPDMRVIVDHSGPQCAIFVDVFDGDPRLRVTAEIEGEPASIVKLSRDGVADPYVVEEFARYRHMCKPWVAAAPSSHVWSGALPHKLEFSGKSLIVRVTFEDARTLTRHLKV